MTDEDAERATRIPKKVSKEELEHFVREEGYWFRYAENDSGTQVMWLYSQNDPATRVGWIHRTNKGIIENWTNGTAAILVRLIDPSITAAMGEPKD